MYTWVRVGSRSVPVASDADFSELLVKHIGDDAKRYYEDRINELLDVIKDAYNVICSWRHDVDEARDILREALEENGRIDEGDEE